MLNQFAIVVGVLSCLSTFSNPAFAEPPQLSIVVFRETADYTSAELFCGNQYVCSLYCGMNSEASLPRLPSGRYLLSTDTSCLIKLTPSAYKNNLAKVVKFLSPEILTFVDVAQSGVPANAPVTKAEGTQDHLIAFVGRPEQESGPRWGPRVIRDKSSEDFLKELVKANVDDSNKSGSVEVQLTVIDWTDGAVDDRYISANSEGKGVSRHPRIGYSKTEVDPVNEGARLKHNDYRVLLDVTCPPLSNVGVYLIVTASGGVFDKLETDIFIRSFVTGKKDSSTAVRASKGRPTRVLCFIPRSQMDAAIPTKPLQVELSSANFDLVPQISYSYLNVQCLLPYSRSEQRGSAIILESPLGWQECDIKADSKQELRVKWKVREYAGDITVAAWSLESGLIFLTPDAVGLDSDHLTHNGRDGAFSLLMTAIPKSVRDKQFRMVVRAAEGFEASIEHLRLPGDTSEFLTSWDKLHSFCTKINTLTVQGVSFASVKVGEVAGKDAKIVMTVEDIDKVCGKMLTARVVASPGFAGELGSLCTNIVKAINDRRDHLSAVSVSGAATIIEDGSIAQLDANLTELVEKLQVLLSGDVK